MEREREKTETNNGILCDTRHCIGQRWQRRRTTSMAWFLWAAGMNRRDGFARQRWKFKQCCIFMHIIELYFGANDGVLTGSGAHADGTIYVHYIHISGQCRELARWLAHWLAACMASSIGAAVVSAWPENLAIEQFACSRSFLSQRNARRTSRRYWMQFNLATGCWPMAGLLLLAHSPICAHSHSFNSPAQGYSYRIPILLL